MGASRLSPEGSNFAPPLEDSQESREEDSVHLRRIAAPTGTTLLSGYIAESSVLSSQDSPTKSFARSRISAKVEEMRRAVLAMTEVTELPKPALFAALVDSHFKDLVHRFPMVTRHDVMGENASVVLRQAICLSGSLTRPSALFLGPELAHSCYEKAKILITIGAEPDILAVLKAMCVLTCWSPDPSSALGLDSPYYWTGVALRLAFQMGLNKRCTYANRPDAGARRLIWWSLFIGDRLQGACFGRPFMIRSSECDVSEPTEQDFDHYGVHAKVFVHCVKACAILGQIVDGMYRRRAFQHGDIAAMTTSLCEWIQGLPPDLQLYDTSGTRQVYHQAVSELHIFYFTIVMLLEALATQNEPRRRTTMLSIAASSCVARLYEEILCRDEVTLLLPINSFYCMVAAIPQIYHRPQNAAREKARQEELQVLISVVEQMKLRFGGSETVLGNISKLCKDVQAEPGPETGPLRSVLTLQSSAIGDSADKLFQFARRLSANVDLLCTTEGRQGTTTETSPLPGENFYDWAFTESLPYLNLLGLDGDIGISDELPTSDSDFQLDSAISQNGISGLQDSQICRK